MIQEEMKPCRKHWDPSGQDGRQRSIRYVLNSLVAQRYKFVVMNRMHTGQTNKESAGIDKSCHVKQDVQALCEAEFACEDAVFTELENS